MSTELSQNSAGNRVRTIADYQFGKGAGAAIFPDECTFKLSTTKRIRYVMLDGVRIATVRAHDGRFTLSIEGAERLWRYLPAPAYRVTVAEEVAEYIMKGKNAMAKHVTAADPAIMAGEEVLVVTGDDKLIGTGNALLSGDEMMAFNYGGAVQVRSGRLI
ncbi:PUA domain-containing protein [Methanogenium organophilum]|uniref:Pseudouridine synthase n=1 Tax=Methanogenium organophilum TaxID=2199 RepID=A0A9X9S4Z8_METOG|nr:PUA domain-containing protein [Methanogenium organophilum]WAI01641.1 pseudouridine synthase [Methanogenium organophilum]